MEWRSTVGSGLYGSCGHDTGARIQAPLVEHMREDPEWRAFISGEKADRDLQEELRKVNILEVGEGEEGVVEDE